MVWIPSARKRLISRVNGSGVWGSRLVRFLARHMAQSLHSLGSTSDHRIPESHRKTSGEAEAFVRLDFLDALRCFAALYVLIFHVAWLPAPRLELPPWLANYVINGSTGVSLFFVLSAFALSYSLDSRPDARHLKRHFYLRRFFRIAPLFYLMLALYYIKDALLAGIHHSGREVLINASLLFNLLPSHIQGYVWASWTIGVEVLFYLIFPLIFRYARDIPSALSLFLAAVLVSQGWPFFVEHYAVHLGYVSAEQVDELIKLALPRQLPVFVSGVLAYRLYFDYFIHLEPERRHRLGLLFILLFAVLYSALLANKLDRVLWDNQIWLGFSYACLVLGLGLRPLGLLVNRVTVGLGKISYSLYLLHPTLVVFLAPVYYRLYAAIPNRTLALLSCFAVTLVVLTGASLVTYRFVERVGIRLGEALIRRGRAPVAAAAQ